MVWDTDLETSLFWNHEQGSQSFDSTDYFKFIQELKDPHFTWNGRMSLGELFTHKNLGTTLLACIINYIIIVIHY